MTALVDAALEQAGLADVLEARRAGELAVVVRQEERLRGLDLLVLGALADRIRALEVGDEVRIYANVRPEDAADVVLVHKTQAEGADDGLGFLRAVALARIIGPRAARVRVDWSNAGLELAQVALGFGASELVGPIASKRGLPIAEGEMSGLGKKSERVSMALVKKRELAGFVERSGRKPVFVGESVAESDGPAQAAPSAGESS